MNIITESLTSPAIPFAAKIPGLPTDICSAAYENLVIDTRNICGGMAGLTTCKVGSKLYHHLIWSKCTKFCKFTKYRKYVSLHNDDPLCGPYPIFITLPEFIELTLVNVLTLEGPNYSK